VLFFLGVVWGCGATWGFGALYLVCFWGGLLLGAGGGGVGGVEAGRPAPRAQRTGWGDVRVGVTDRCIPIYEGKKLVGYRAEVVSVTDYYSFGAEISMRSYEAQPWYRYGYIEAHKDAPPSPVKLFVGSYRGTIRVVDDRTLELIAYNTTTPNSLFYHIGRYLSDRGTVNVRIHLGKPLYPFLSFRPTEREYRFLINIEK
jgi:hypothetical protein